MSSKEKTEKKEKLAKPAPEGVSEEKYDSCVEQVKEEKGDKNAYAICASSLKKGELDWSDLQKSEPDALAKHSGNGQWSLEPLNKNVNMSYSRPQNSPDTGMAGGMAKDDKPHPPGSPEDSAHDAVEDPKRTVYDEIKELSDDEARQMLQHLRNMKKKGKEDWKRSKENRKKGKD